MAASNSAGGKQTHHSVRDGASRVQPVEQRHRRGVNHAELAAKRPQRVLFASGRRRRPRRAASPPRRRHSSGRAAARGRKGGKERARGANMPRTSGAQHVRAPRGRCSRPRRSPERCGVAQGRVARHGVAFRTKTVVRLASLSPRDRRKTAFGAGGSVWLNKAEAADASRPSPQRRVVLGLNAGGLGLGAAGGPQPNRFALPR